MRRIAMGFVWFLVIHFLTNGVGGAFFGALNAAKTGATGFASGAQAGYAGGVYFRQHYGIYTLLFSIFVSVVGTWGAILPGTKKKKPVPSGADPEKALAAGNADGNPDHSRAAER